MESVKGKFLRDAECHMKIFVGFCVRAGLVFRG
jgi:hypothetical protein